MKLTWNGLYIELTVDELKQMVDKKLITPGDEKVPYPDTWLELIKRANPAVKPAPTVDPFPTIALYGCQFASPLTNDLPAQWDGTTALGGTGTASNGTDEGQRDGK